jgi:DNA-binding response OmpR family regulator
MTPPYWPRTSRTARSPGVAEDPVKPCATTNTSRLGPASWRTAIRIPSTVVSVSDRFTIGYLDTEDPGDDATWVLTRFTGPTYRCQEVAALSSLLLLTNALQPCAEVLPALGLLSHTVRILPAEASALLDAPLADVVLVDGRRELPATRSLCRVLRTTGVGAPILLVTTEGGLTAVTTEWGVDDVILDTAGPAELEARLRLAITRLAVADPEESTEIHSGEVSIDEGSYTARVRGRVLDLTFKEFELLKFLAQHPGRVFTRAQLLQEVWGYDYFGGTRTVDVHVRRLRAKLGPEHDQSIGTVRNVGYRFVVTPLAEDATADQELIELS